MDNLNIFGSFFGVKKLNQDLKKIKKTCLSLQKNNQNIIKSNKGGHQYHFDKNVLSSLTNQIEKEANIFVKNLNLIKDVYIQNIWLNVNKHKDMNMPHIHPKSICSGVFYVEVFKNSGDLVFENPNDLQLFLEDSVKEYNIYNSCIWRLKPLNNNLVLFPSWMKHYVDMNLSNKDRISISFNLNFI